MDTTFGFKDIRAPMGKSMGGCLDSFFKQNQRKAGVCRLLVSNFGDGESRGQVAEWPGQCPSALSLCNLPPLPQTALLVTGLLF